MFSFVAFGEPAASPPPAPNGPAKAASGESDDSGWVFSFLPTAFQKNPFLYQTVITEVTELGKKLPPVSRQAPAYYVAYTDGPFRTGEVSGGDKPQSPQGFRGPLVRSLAQAGYYRAKIPSHPPTLLIVYTWGESEWGFLDQCALIGGKEYALKVWQLMRYTYDLDHYELPLPGSGSSPILTPWALDFALPINLYKRSEPGNEFLLDQADEDLYFVIVSAYDYKSAAANERKLLWRTQMTVSARGVTKKLSLPTLILSAAPFFGKDMAGPEVLIKREIPAGKVKIGTPKVIEMPAEEDAPGRGDKP